MAEVLNQEQSWTFEKILTGSTLSELRSTEAWLNEQDDTIRFAEFDASKLTDTDKKTKALLLTAKARKSLTDSRNAFQAAKAKYNETVRVIMIGVKSYNDITGSNVSSPGFAGMSDLGVAPLVLAGIAAAAIGVGYLLSQFSTLWLVAQGKISSTKGIMEEITDLLQATSSLVNTLLIAGGIGLGVYLFFRFKKGSLKDFFKPKAADKRADLVPDTSKDTSKTPLVVAANPYYLKKGGGAYYRNDIQPKWHESDAGPFDSILQAEDSGSDDFWFNNGRKLKGRPVQSKRAIAAYKKGLCSTNKISNYF